MKRKSQINKSLLIIRAIYVKEMKIWLRYPSWIFTFIALPYMISGLFYGIGYSIAGPSATKNFASNTGIDDPFLYYLLGSLVFMMTTLICEDIGSSIRMEQMRGTFELHYLSPSNKALIWSSYILPHGTISLLTMFISALPPLIYRFGFQSIISLIIGLLILFIGIIPVFGIGLIMAALTVKYKEPWAVINVVRTIITVCSGFYYPLTILPYWLQLVSQFIPTSHITMLLREVLLANRRLIFSDYRFTLLLFLSLIYFVLGYGFFVRWERNARRSGELSKY